MYDKKINEKKTFSKKDDPENEIQSQQTDKIMDFFSYLRSMPQNKSCYDCGTPNPLWAYVKYSKFVCTACASKYRKKGIKVKNTILDVFNGDEARRMSINVSKLDDIDKKFYESCKKYPGLSFIDVFKDVNQNNHEVYVTNRVSVKKNNLEKGKKRISNSLGIVEDETSSEESNDEKNLTKNNFNNKLNDNLSKDEPEVSKRTEHITISKPFQVKKSVQLKRGSKKYTLESQNDVVAGLIDVDEKNDNEGYSYKNINSASCVKNSSKSEIIEDVIDSIKNVSKSIVGNVINKFKKKN
ncbi:ADP-ribosylation factor GTPase-activating protein 2 [Dictyocoela muelleri]|nr:ADP-ribosylation factor GTPase-activating protein 2 [Dictyocoela muelleri]